MKKKKIFIKIIAFLFGLSGLVSEWKIFRPVVLIVENVFSQSDKKDDEPVNVVKDSIDYQAREIEIAENCKKYNIYPKLNHCQQWAREVWEEATGMKYRNAKGEKYGSALAACKDWGVYTDFSEIEVGMHIYGDKTYTDVPGGHVGIYIGDGIVIHNIGKVKKDSLEDWINIYGGIAYGWPMGVDLSNEDLLVENNLNNNYFISDSFDKDDNYIYNIHEFVSNNGEVAVEKSNLLTYTNDSTFIKIEDIQYINEGNVLTRSRVKGRM